jgi:hydroxymethylpyrimidine/phosphomethylpyrimidine kinase
MASPVATPPVALTVAGSDSSGGAGVPADLKTFAMHQVYGACVVTALTAQNGAGVRAVERVSEAMVAAQLDAVLADLPVRAVKTGMLAHAGTVTLLASRAAELPNLVVDPVLTSSTGHCLCDGPAARTYLDRLLPHATVVTPNLAEAGALLGRRLSTLDEATAAAEELSAAGGGWIVVTGGHLDGDPVDVLCHAGRVELLRTPRVRTANDHGTGCTFSAAIAARLALGDPPGAAVRAAKHYVHRALTAAIGWRLGSGAGPLSWEAS